MTTTQATDTYTLSNGVRIPALGLGTWFIGNDVADEAVKTATRLGYRHIDSAQAYGNEQGVGKGVRACGLAREELFVTSKVAAEAKTYERAAASIDETLQKMGLDHLDLMLIHSPQPWAGWGSQDRHYNGNIQAWKALEDAYSAGKLKAIGVSNFQRADLENIFDNCQVKPMVNQLLVHAGNTPADLIAFCQKHDVLVEAYSPIAHGKALDDKTIVAMAQKYGVSVAQLCIRYALDLGCVVLPKASTEAHMRENADVDFAISAQDMDALRTVQFTDYGEYSYFPVFSGR